MALASILCVKSKKRPLSLGIGGWGRGLNIKRCVLKLGRLLTAILLRNLIPHPVSVIKITTQLYLTIFALWHTGVKIGIARLAGTTVCFPGCLRDGCAWEGAPWPLFLTSFVAIGGWHHRTNGHAEGRASQRRSGTRAQAANHSMPSPRRVVAIASDSAFSLPALLGRALREATLLVNSKVFELCTRF